MLNKFKFELNLFFFTTIAYVLYSLYYIGERIYSGEYDDYSLPFNVAYFGVILTIHLYFVKYTIRKIKSNQLLESMKYFDWIFILTCISLVMTCTVGSYSQETYYHKIVDIHTLVSSLSFQLITLFPVYIRISKKIDKIRLAEENANKDAIEDENGNSSITPYSTVTYV